MSQKRSFFQFVYNVAIIIMPSDIRQLWYHSVMHHGHADFCIYSVPVSVNPRRVGLAPEVIFVCRPNIALNSSHGNRLGKT